VVLSELRGGITLRFQGGGERNGLIWYPNRRQPRADGQLAGDEIGAPRR
jgi:hypothetical protein